jgi:hypothetical protein
MTNISYRTLLLAFAIAYAGLAVGRLLIAMNLAQGATPLCQATVAQCLRGAA